MRERNALSFSYLYKEITKKGKPNRIGEDMKLLFEIAACFLAVPEAGGLAAFVKLMSGGSVIQAGAHFIESAKTYQENGYSNRMLQMRELYAAICFTAFFDTVKNVLTEDIYSKIALSEDEKQALFRESTTAENIAKNLNRDLLLPELAFGSEKLYTFLRKLYGEMTQHLSGFVTKLSFRETASEKDIRIFDEMIRHLPEEALCCFKDQYLTLCTVYPSFYAYIQFGKEEEYTAQIEEAHRQLMSLLSDTNANLEQGLEIVRQVLMEQPVKEKERAVREITDQLFLRNQTRLKRAVVESEDEKLRFPPLEEAFIPQHYRLLSYTGQEALEQRKTWGTDDPNKDMNAFWLKYRMAMDNVERLLLVLGEPGSGKSLLTEVLAARLSSKDDVVVRIPLRACLMEDSIEHIICQQIARDGDASSQIPTLKWIAEEFKSKPITLLFDGYDEVQQATGLAYHRFLNDLAEFQRECLQNNRPVRIVITSRATLIDKVDIPKGTLIMRLEEFDPAQKQKWIIVWNKYNREVFAEAGLEEFSLPPHSCEIADLSKQPLLLLMLAIYDADFENMRNALKQDNAPGKSLNRTQLYDELLRRFIRRELYKGERGNSRSYAEATSRERNMMVGEEIRKLGIAALGMLIREKLSITVAELRTDFEALNAVLPSFEPSEKRRIEREELFLGSFFFIHDSRERNKKEEDGPAGDVDEASFVFLHKTFYEFLAADYILQSFFSYVLELCDTMTVKPSMYPRELHNLSDDFSTCFYALNGACLCIEPAILQMIAEWKDEKLNRCLKEEKNAKRTDVHMVMRESFATHFDLILEGKFNKTDGLLKDHSSSQLAAVYLLNAVTLQTLICGQFRFDWEKWRYCSRYIMMNLPRPRSDRQKDEKKRAFSIDTSEEIPLKFMALFQLGREGEEVLIQRRESPVELEGKNLLEARIELCRFTQDDIGVKLCMLHDPTISTVKKESILEKLNNQGMGLATEQELTQLELMLESEESCDGETFELELRHALAYLDYHQWNSSTLMRWLLCFRQFVYRAQQPRSFLYLRDHELWKEISNATRLFTEGYTKIGISNNDQLFLIWLDIVQMLGAESTLFEIIQKNSFIWMSGECFQALMKVMRQIPDREKFRFDAEDFSFKGIRRRTGDETMCGRSPAWYAAYLKLLRYVGNTEGERQELKICAMHFLTSFLHDTSLKTLEELPTLLNECMQIGCLAEIKLFLDTLHLPSWYVPQKDRLLSERLLELLEIESIVGSGSVSKQLAESAVLMNWDEETLALALRVASRLLAQNSANPHTARFVHNFLNEYRIAFATHPLEALNLLNRIVRYGKSKRSSFVDADDLNTVMEYALYIFPTLLCCSLPSAAHLLLSAIRLKMLSGTRIVPYYLDCLNAALVSADSRNGDLLVRLTKKLDVVAKEALKEKLRSQMPYIRRVLPSLAFWLQNEII